MKKLVYLLPAVAALALTACTDDVSGSGTDGDTEDTTGGDPTTGPTPTTDPGTTTDDLIGQHGGDRVFVKNPGSRNAAELGGMPSRVVF